MILLLLIFPQICFGHSLSFKIENPGTIFAIEAETNRNLFEGENVESLQDYDYGGIIDSRLIIENLNNENQLEIEDYELGQIKAERIKTFTPETVLLMVVVGALAVVAILFLTMVAIFKIIHRKKKNSKQTKDLEVELGDQMV